MRPHFVVRLRPGIEAPERPHWIAARRTKGGAEQAPTQAIGRALQQRGVAMWTTREYAPSAAAWSRAELAAGLDRVYRLILRTGSRIPPGLIEDIRLLPEVAEVRFGDVAAVPIARPRAAAAGAPGFDAARRAIGLPRAHALTRGHPDVLVAVLDTGIDLEHRDRPARLRPGIDCVDILDGASEFIGDFLGADEDPADEVGHGTHVAGIIGARGKGMPPGVAPQCTYLPVRVLAAMLQEGRRVGAGAIDNINVGVKYAIDRGAHIVNMSLGVRHSGGGLPHREVVSYAAERGVLIVAASGNDGSQNLYFPGAYDTVLTVGSVGPDGAVSDFSTYGPQVSIVAPGEDIYSTVPGGGYGFASGTSHAAPFAAGVAALVQSLALASGGRFDDRELREILTRSSDRIGEGYKDRRAGHGRLNALDALQLAATRIS